MTIMREYSSRRKQGDDGVVSRRDSKSKEVT